ncbi:MAG: putative ABC transporter ATP-binding protein [Chloroflexi bacterium OLB13]|nr:MAG: putative ABC transporter ATP-binding protein [Chloroflexi bacterium OLB13]
MSFNVSDGQIVSLLGPNGAGKSTTLKAISGLLRGENGEITRGSVTWHDERLNVLTAEDIVRRGVIQVIEGRPLFRHLTVEENLMTGAMAYQARATPRPTSNRSFIFFRV